MSLPQGVLGAAGLTGLLVGLLLAGAPALYWWLSGRRLRQRGAGARAEEAAAHRRNQVIVENSGEGVLELDRAGRVLYANPAAAKILGYEPEELPGLDYQVLINTSDDGKEAGDTVSRVRYTTNIQGGAGALLRRKSGEYRPVEYKMSPITDGVGVTRGTVLVFRDITERVRSDNLLKEMQTIAKVGGWEHDILSSRTYWTDAVYAIHELPPGAPLSPELLEQFFDEKDLPRLREAQRIAFEFGLSSDMRMQCTTALGRKVWLRIIARAERRHGVTTRLHGAVQDVTELVEAERQLREARDFLDLTLNAVPMPIAYVAQAGEERVVTYANRAMSEWLEKPVDRMVGKPVEEVFAPESCSAMRTALETPSNEDVMQIRASGVRAGATREFLVYLVARREMGGALSGFFIIVYDLTEQKRLEARLLQAQKMEVIGQLTGGIAHDFNNLLGVVIGNLQLLERSVPDDPAVSRKVHTALRAAVRGADLTRRLLAFARRQMLDPIVLDPNRQLISVSELIQRTLGESIEVRMVQTPDLWSTRVDAAQFENAILNLAINARDAMPNGGKLTVRTQNVKLDSVFCLAHPSIEPGEYVSISVTDSGVGIEPDVLKRVFEPFFTTKESGRGSGLGLAMVHGFAEQAGGVATIDSQLGRGTTVTVYLPRCVEEQSEHIDTIVTRTAPGGSETILVVEDDADLRETAVTALSQLGYRAIPAPNAAAALRILASPQHIDLLFTDVMMPGGVLGPALAKRARELRPGLNVLFTTGYAENAVLAGAGPLGVADVISKPYRNEELATRIRLMLDREMRVA